MEAIGTSGIRQRFDVSGSNDGIREVFGGVRGESEAQRLVVPAAAVRTERSAETGEEGEEERDECAQDHPVGVTPVGIETAVVQVVASNAEENHLDDPSDKRHEERKRRDEGHEDGAHAVVAGTT